MTIFIIHSSGDSPQSNGLKQRPGDSTGSTGGNQGELTFTGMSGAASSGPNSKSKAGSGAGAELALVQLSERNQNL